MLTVALSSPVNMNMEMSLAEPSSVRVRTVEIQNGFLPTCSIICLCLRRTRKVWVFQGRTKLKVISFQLQITPFYLVSNLFWVEITPVFITTTISSLQTKQTPSKQSDHLLTSSSRLYLSKIVKCKCLKQIKYFSCWWCLLPQGVAGSHDNDFSG